eukprot:2925563-Pleurochrysis_carterae.AAC.1
MILPLGAKPDALYDIQRFNTSTRVSALSIDFYALLFMTEIHDFLLEYSLRSTSAASMQRPDKCQKSKASHH